MVADCPPEVVTLNVASPSFTPYTTPSLMVAISGFSEFHCKVLSVALVGAKNHTRALCCPGATSTGAFSKVMPVVATAGTLLSRPSNTNTDEAGRVRVSSVSRLMACPSCKPSRAAWLPKALVKM